MKEIFPFLKRKEQGPVLRFAHLAPEIWKTLEKLPRSIWAKKGIQDAETVGQHTISAMNLVAGLHDKLSASEQEEILSMLEVHAWPQALSKNSDEEESSLLEDMSHISSICEKLGTEGERILAIWQRFATSQDSLADLAREIDVYQTIEQAHMYDKKYTLGLFPEIYNRNISFITHPALKTSLTDMMKTYLAHGK